MTLELFQCSCFSIWAHLPKDIFYSSINDSFPAKYKKKKFFFNLLNEGEEIKIIKKLIQN